MAIDISGRHAVQGKYKMVCAVVSARVSPNFVEKIHTVRIMPRMAEALDLNVVADFISEACVCLPGTIVAESGDFYNQEIWRARSILGRDLKYPETIAERTLIEMAHHISVAGRKLIIEPGEDNKR